MLLRISSASTAFNNVVKKAQGALLIAVVHGSLTKIRMPERAASSRFQRDSAMTVPDEVDAPKAVPAFKVSQHPASLSASES
jgi:hypothetical protein